MTADILWNPAALGALKRHQLVSLSKKYGVKASGKTLDMIERLQEYAATVPSNTKLYVPEPESTPPSQRLLPIPTEVPSPLAQASSLLSADPAELNKKASIISTHSEWSILSESGASFVSPIKESNSQSSVRSWKSAGNGQPLNEFGEATGLRVEDRYRSNRSGRSSVSAIASSLRRNVSKHLSTRSTSNRSTLPTMSTSSINVPFEEERKEEMIVPPSPASTVGIPRRYSRMTLMERPSTVRLCSPTPGDELPDNIQTDLPLIHGLKERRSMAPMKSTSPSGYQLGLNRKSLPALANNLYSESISSLYPRLPNHPSFQALNDSIPPVPPLPSHLTSNAIPKAKQESPAVFQFGSPDHAVSSTGFSEAAQEILKQMNEKLGNDMKMNGEVLKGKKANLGRMVSVNAELGEGGWGLMGSFEGKKDRFADAHEREFAKMRSISKTSTAPSHIIKSKRSIPPIPGTPAQKRKVSENSVADMPSAPNGAPLVETGNHQRKKMRLSNGPNYLGSLREAGRSVMTLLGDTDLKSDVKAAVVEMKARSGVRGKTGIRARLSLFRNNFRKRQAGLTPAEKTEKINQTLRRRSIELAKTFAIPDELPINAPYSVNRPSRPRQARERNPSTSAQTVLSTRSKTPARKPIPDFGGRIVTGSSGRAPSFHFGSISTSERDGGSLKSSLRKQSQADMIKKARPAPPPPSLSTGSKRSSTLYQPTASSLARMQATIRPPPSAMRPLPMAPPPPSSFTPVSITTSNPFGMGESRENLFEENFNAPPPVPIFPQTDIKMKSPTPRPAGPRSNPLSPRKITAGPSGSRIRQKIVGYNQSRVEVI